MCHCLHLEIGQCTYQQPDKQHAIPGASNATLSSPALVFQPAGHQSGLQPSQGLQLQFFLITPSTYVLRLFINTAADGQVRQSCQRGKHVHCTRT